MSNAVSLQAAYLLHYKQYGDANFIVDLFTLDYGRIALMAKGARGSKPKTRALYQPFRPLLITWWGDSELRTLTGIEESGAALELTGTALPCGYYLNEILLRLLVKDQAQQTLFAHYSMAVSQLADPNNNPEPILREFEMQLLDALGLLPDFAHCTDDGEAIQVDQHYWFYPSSSQAVLDRDETAHLAIPKKKQPDAVLHADGVTVEEGVRISGHTLKALADFDINQPIVLEEIKPLMRRVLRQHLGDQPLNSRSLFASLTPPPPPPPKSDITTS